MPMSRITKVVKVVAKKSSEGSSSSEGRVITLLCIRENMYDNLLYSEEKKEMLTQPSSHIQFATEELSVNGVKYVNHLKLVQAEANIVELQKERVVELQGRLFSV